MKNQIEAMSALGERREREGASCWTALDINQSGQRVGRRDRRLFALAKEFRGSSQVLRSVASPKQTTAIDPWRLPSAERHPIQIRLGSPPRLWCQESGCGAWGAAVINQVQARHRLLRVEPAGLHRVRIGDTRQVDGAALVGQECAPVIVACGARDQGGDIRSDRHLNAVSGHSGRTGAGE